MEEFCTQYENIALFCIQLFKNLQVRASNRIFQPMKGTGIASQVVVRLVGKKDIVKKWGEAVCFCSGQSEEMHNVKAVDNHLVQDDDNSWQVTNGSMVYRTAVRDIDMSHLYITPSPMKLIIDKYLSDLIWIGFTKMIGLRAIVWFWHRKAN